MKRVNGLEWLEEREGEGSPARKGDTVVYNTKMFLNRGDEVPLNDQQAQYLPKEMIRVEGGLTLVNHKTILGRRQAIAGVEQALTGMKAGGYRKVRIGPHLAYRDKGIPDLIPPNAVLTVEIWLREIVEERKVRA
jgi:FKBP-type peptidyl-prolyl cis-trans isomerase (trigger factor)